MIPVLQLALAILIYIVGFLLVAGIVLAAFLLPRFLRDAKKHSEEMEKSEQEFDENWNRGAYQFPRRKTTVNYNGSISPTDIKRVTADASRNAEKGGMS